MTTTTVDWSTLTIDPASAPSVEKLEALARGFETRVPTVLIPLRVETRFTTVQVPDPTAGIEELIGRVRDVADGLHRLAEEHTATTLTGTVTQQRVHKAQVENPLYERIEAHLEAVAAAGDALGPAMELSVTSVTGEQMKALAEARAQVGAAAGSARTAVAALRSDYQRARFGGALEAHLVSVEGAMRDLAARVEPGLRLAAALDIIPASRAARELGRAPDGRPLRPGLQPGPGSRAPRRVVVDDGASVEALGATRVVPLEPGQLTGAAASAERIRARLADPSTNLDDGLVAEAAGMALLPGAVKEELLALLDRAARRPGAAELRAEIAATPSDRPALDAEVPERLAGTVWVLRGTTRTVHQLLVRIYPEPLAVDSHEDDLTEAEQAAGTAFWAAWAAAGNDVEQRKGAWRAVCIGRSTRRAAWIARATQTVAPRPTRGSRDADRILDALSAAEKRLAELDADRLPLAPGPRPSRRPVGRPSKALTPRQVAGTARALRSLGKTIDAATEVPTAASSTIAARLRALLGAVTALTIVFRNVPKEWATSLEQMAESMAELPSEAPPEPSLPVVGTRSGTWTRAASSTVLPSRFAVFAVDGGRATKVAAGNPIDPELALGLAPRGDGFSLDDGALVVPDSIRWMTDFDEAVDKGMALRITISAHEAQVGFDELLVLGLCDGDAADGATRLTAMLEAHHYTGDGLSLLPVGTATNNTEDEASGHSSRDDAGQAFAVELGPDLTAAISDSDGVRLAAALGIHRSVFAHVSGADGTDASDALNANQALYPGTIGHAIEELAPGVISRDGRARLRSYALADVAGRALLPAIRVDDQPYALLPAVAISLLQPDIRDAGLGRVRAAERDRQLRFEQTMLALFQHLHADWSAMREGSDGGPGVKHLGSPEVGRPGFDAQQHFLTMLGLEPSSVTASYRFAVNVADRAAVRGEPDLGLAFGLPPVHGSTTGAAALGPFALMEHLADVFRTALGLPAVAPRDQATGRVSAAWEGLYEELRTSRAYGLRLLTGQHPLQGAVSVEAAVGTTGTGAWILRMLTLTLEDLRARTEQLLSNVGLAELFVRQALLAEARRAAAEILVSGGLVSEQALAAIGTSSLYQTWSSGTGQLSRMSTWGLLFSTVNQVVELGGSGAAVPAALDHRTMSEVIQAAPPASVSSHRAAVTRFAQLPAERMTALTREHLDLASHRLDAWIGGLAHRRMRTMRRRRPAGSHVGSYGWVENLRPKPTAPAASAVPAALAGLPGRPLTRDESGEGFIQAPSPAHAVTAAVLRAAYRSQRAEGSFSEMSVNLSSNRVRVALSLIDGVRAGNDLGELLGYRLERFLHEYYERPDTPTVVELDSTIFPLRRAYPRVATVDPDADATTEPPRFVVDGLALVRAVLDWIETNAPDAVGTVFQTLSSRPGGYPWGVATGALPPSSQPAKLTGVLRGIDAIADALDALGDLTTAETVHQLVRGNHARAAAVLAALAEGRAIPHPEVIDTPRTGLPVTHKLLLQLAPVAAEPVAAPVGWEAVPMTPRAAVEPTVNAWLAKLLGDPVMIRLRLTSDGLAPGAALPEASIADLGLQPLDLVALLAEGFDTAVGSLTARVLDSERPADLPPDQPGVVLSDGPTSSATDAWRIESGRAPAWGPAIRSITDVAPLLEACADLLGRAKPARASDYAAPEVTAAAGDGYDAADLATRCGRLLEGARTDAVALARLLAEDPTLDASVLEVEPAVWLAGLRLSQPGQAAAEHPSGWLPTLDLAGPPDDVAAALARLDGFWADREAWREAAAAAQAYGIRVGLPRRFLSRIQVSRELLQSAEVAFLDLASRCRTAGALVDPVTAPKPAAAWTEAARVLLGDGLTLVPRVVIDPILPDLKAALDAGLARADEVDAWLEGAAAVRPGAADLADLQVLAEALGRPAPAAGVAQLPSVPGEPAVWVGGPVPDPTGITGKVSVVIYSPEHLPAAGASGAALLVDEWSESVPFREEMTGVALHYDQPDATAPQAILVAVPPVLDTPWTLTSFAATLHDTLELARNRTVEVEHIAAGRYGQLLPLLVGEVVPHAVSAVAGDRVILDFHQNNP